MLTLRSAVMDAYFPGVALVRALSFAAQIPTLATTQSHRVPAASRGQVSTPESRIQ
jgi:hypothetical protein